MRCWSEKLGEATTGPQSWPNVQADGGEEMMGREGMSVY